MLSGLTVRQRLRVGTMRLGDHQHLIELHNSTLCVARLGRPPRLPPLSSSVLMHPIQCRISSAGKPYTLAFYNQFPLRMCPYAICWTY